MIEAKVKTTIAVIAAFTAGLVVANLPAVLAAPNNGSDLAHKTFFVSIDEVKQNFVFAEEFSGAYSRSITLSDGTQREIELTPMLRDGTQLVRLEDTGGVSYMGLDGTTTNGTLMIQLRDKEAMLAKGEAEGWWQSSRTD